jgi:hypothetical protein
MSAGKGDSPRNCFSETYRENYDNIFRKKVLDGDKKPSTTKEERYKHGKDSSHQETVRAAAS